MTIGLVWAQAANGVIGAGGSLPWHLPEDLARFKALTMGATVVMGRATWDSLPVAVRPLPGRRNVVLSRRPDWVPAGAEVAGSWQEARRLLAGVDVWVIGGARVYREALPDADLVVVTELAEEYAGDTVAPQLGPAWRVRDRDPQHGWHSSRRGLAHRVVTYVPVVPHHPL